MFHINLTVSTTIADFWLYMQFHISHLSSDLIWPVYRDTLDIYFLLQSPQKRTMLRNLINS